MFLKKTKRNGRVYLSVVQNYRQDGKVRSKTIESLGYVDELVRFYPDPINFFTQQVAQMNREREAQGGSVLLTIDRDERIEPDRPGSIQLGSAIALGYLDLFGVGKSLALHPHAGRVLELLVSARMLHAVPVHETWNSRNKFTRACDFSYSQVFASLEDLAEAAPSLVRSLNARYDQVRGPRLLDNVRIVFSNYVFNWPDDDASGGPDEMGLQGRARLCLAIDGGGIPYAYRMVPYDMDADQVVDLVLSLKDEVGARHAMLVAAQLPEAVAVMDALTANGDGFVLLQPAESLARETIEWIDDPEGYDRTRNGSYGIKSHRIARHSTDSRGGVHDLKEIALRSSSATGSQAFCIVSSEVDRSDAAIFNVYRELWRVHEPFQVISADFIQTPYPLDARAHLKAHFLVCYVAFFLLRVLRQDMDWRFNAAEVADALLAMEGAYVSENWYVFNYRTAVTDAVQQAAGVPVGKRLMSRAEIRGVPALISA